MMAPLFIRMTRRLQLPTLPYVIAVATASNVGSTATITGNPQNILIGSLSGLKYVDFMVRLGPVAILGLVLDWWVIHWIYLRGTVDRVQVADAFAGPGVQHPWLRKKPVVVLAIVLGGFLAGVPAAIMAAIGAALLLITRTVEPRHVYDNVDWGLLVFFVGLFVIVGGADRVRLTSELLRPVQTWDLHRIPIFVIVTGLLSNVVSNVPAVMLLRTLVPGFPDPTTGWLVLAMASTLAGNLTITGSVANIIVVERAAADGVDVSYRDYVRVGIPLTAVTIVIGSLWLWVTA
jgi:Na+/H+ antiporter NhaD/arsenite permease-like protein